MKSMWAVSLPAIAWILCYLVLRRTLVASRRLCVLEATLATGALLAVATEALSLVGAISRTSIVGFWLLAGVCGVLIVLWQGENVPSLVRREIRTLTSEARRNLDLRDWVCLIPVGLILAGTFAIGIVAPPNNWDSMTYHMPRVMHWIQNGSLEFYPTAITRQNYMPPFAEEVILHLQLLSGGDRFANLVQWFAFLLSMLAVSYLAGLLGVARPVQCLAALLAATLPMAILQSTSTQNDLVAGFFLVAFVAHLLRFAEAFQMRDAVFGGIALGLGLLTKGTIYIYGAAAGTCLGLFIFMGWRAWPSKGFVTRAGLLGAGMVVALNVGHWTRNLGDTGHPLGRESRKVRNDETSMEIFAANFVRNSTLHLALPSDAWNLLLEQWSSRLLGSEVNNPASTWKREKYRVRHVVHEDLSGNTLHFAVIVLSNLLLLARIRHARPEQIVVGMAALSGAIAFCGMLKWQPWASRLHTPLFMLALPLAASVVPFRRQSRGGTISAGRSDGHSSTTGEAIGFGVLGVIALVAAVPFIVSNPIRPILPVAGRSVFYSNRTELMFASRVDLEREYDAVLHALASTVSTGDGVPVGLLVEPDGWEYPLWCMAAQRGMCHVRWFGVAREDPVRPMCAFLVATWRADSPLEVPPDYRVVIQGRYAALLEIDPTKRGE